MRACIMLLTLRKISPVGKRAAVALGEGAGDAEELRDLPVP